MKTRSMNVQFAFAFLGAVHSLRGAEPPEVDAARMREAVERGVKIVEKAAGSYPKHRACFSCHHQTLPLLAMSAAADRGIRIDRQLFQSQAAFTHRSFQGKLARVREGEDVGGASLTVGYGLWTLDLASWRRDETTDAMASFLLLKQEPNGSWKPTTSRPPIEDSTITCTVLAAYYLERLAAPEARPRAAADKARAWLLGASPSTQEDHTFRLWGLKLFGAGEPVVAAAREAVLGAQRDDGGWGQLPNLASDAYATGQTLYVLLETGTPAGSPACRRAASFLLETQCADGSWFVKSRSKPIQLLFDNGDPHGTDQFISTAATSWAAAALARVLPKGLFRRV